MGQVVPKGVEFGARSYEIRDWNFTVNRHICDIMANRQPQTAKPKTETETRNLDETMMMNDGETPTTIIVARHGERLDYTIRDSNKNDDSNNNRNWVKGAERPWDSPLTDHGHSQARALGRELRRQVLALNLPQIESIYSSPLLRCRETSAGIRNSLLIPLDEEERDESNGAEHDIQDQLKIKVEEGLMESINESWYRSWALPESDGTWGLIPNDDRTVNPETLHPMAKIPIQTILLNNRKIVCNEAYIDKEYTSRTKLSEQYTFQGPRRLLEKASEQQERMLQTVKTLGQPGKTVVLVSHGGPVTHLYKKLIQIDDNSTTTGTATGRIEHGPSSYCCYSIYQKGDENDGGWRALVVNEASYLNEQILIQEDHLTVDGQVNGN